MIAIITQPETYPADRAKSRGILAELILRSFHSAVPFWTRRCESSGSAMAPSSLELVDLLDPTKFETEADLLRRRSRPRGLHRSQLDRGTYPRPLQFSDRKNFFLLPEDLAWEFERLPDDRDRDKARTTEILAHRRTLLQALLAAVDLPPDRIVQDRSALQDLDVPRAMKLVCTETWEKPTFNRLAISYHEALARIECSRVLGVDVEQTRGRWFVDMRALIRRNIERVDPGILDNSIVDAIREQPTSTPREARYAGGRLEDHCCRWP